MIDPRMLLAQAAPPQPQQDMFRDFVIPMALMFGVFYFIWLRPMRAKQRRQEQLLQELKSGDRVIINPGIFGTIAGVEADSFYVRVDDKTKIRVLKSAVSGLQATPAETETK